MNRISQEARKRQSVVKLANKKAKIAAEQYGVSLSSIKRWCRRYDGDWKSLKEKSHRPHSHPGQHTTEEEALIREAFKRKFYRYGRDGACREAQANGYTRSFSGFVYAAKRMGLLWQRKNKRVPRRHDRRYPELSYPGEKVQMDVREVPYNCLRGPLKQDKKRLYQWTAIDECTRYRFVYIFEEHMPENTVRFLKMLIKTFPFPIKTLQTDNGTEFIYKFISDEKESPLDTELKRLGIEHKLIPPRTPWHNGKVERSHRNDQRCFYDWGHFRSVKEVNDKLKEHLAWNNSKPMRILGNKTPEQLLQEKLPLVPAL